MWHLQHTSTIVGAVDSPVVTSDMENAQTGQGRARVPLPSNASRHTRLTASFFMDLRRTPSPTNRPWQAGQKWYVPNGFRNRSSDSLHVAQ